MPRQPPSEADDERWAKKALQKNWPMTIRLDPNFRIARAVPSLVHQAVDELVATGLHIKHGALARKAADLSFCRTLNNVIRNFKSGDRVELRSFVRRFRLLLIGFYEVLQRIRTLACELLEESAHNFAGSRFERLAIRSDEHGG